jgi:hypothetical protein
MVGFLIGLCGGGAIVLSPWFAFRQMQEQTNQVFLWAFGMSGILGFILGLVFAQSSFLAALLGLGLAGTTIFLLGRDSAGEADYVVEGPLLGDALSPELTTELIRLEAETLESELSPQQPKEIRRRKPKEQ